MENHHRTKEHFPNEVVLDLYWKYVKENGGQQPRKIWSSMSHFLISKYKMTNKQQQDMALLHKEFMERMGK